MISYLDHYCNIFLLISVRAASAWSFGRVLLQFHSFQTINLRTLVPGVTSVFPPESNCSAAAAQLFEQRGFTEQ